MASIVIQHGGEVLQLISGRAAYWPSRSTLLVADLHLGKAESMQVHGVGVPAGAGDESLARLSGLIATTGASRVIVLGDLLHAPEGLTEGLIARVAAWRSGISATLCLVPGNHDRKVHRAIVPWGLTMLPERHTEGGLTLTHEPPTGEADAHGSQDRHDRHDRPDTQLAYVAGHVHPALGLRGAQGGRKVPCFVLSQRVLILPAFSRFTGGVPVRLDATERAHARFFAVTDEGVIEA
jgi:DNA ligase-associated metallophosphoesterase